MSRVMATALAMLILAAPGAAQRQPPVQEGARVRFTPRANPGAKWIGIVLPSTSDSLVVEFPAGEVFRTPLRQLEALQVSTGTRSKWLEGAVIGVVAGVLIGVGAEAGKTNREPDAWWHCAFVYGGCGDPEPLPPPERHYAAAGALGGLGGALVGAFIGATIKDIRWVSIPLDLRLP